MSDVIEELRQDIERLKVEESIIRPVVWKQVDINGRLYHYSISNFGQLRNDTTGVVLKYIMNGFH